MNAFRWNLAWQCRPWVCPSTPNLALIVKRGWYRSPQKCQIWLKIVLFGYRKPTQWTHSDEIWPVSADLGPALAQQIWPSSVKGVGTEAPKMSKFADSCGFWPPEVDAMNTFRWNWAWQSRPWVCSSTPNLTLISKRGWVQESPKYHKLPKIMVFGHRKPTQ